MDLTKVNKFPYILDEWAKVVNEAPEWKFVYDNVATRGIRRAEVDSEASRIYAWLKKQGIGKEDFVMICLPRCAEVVIAVLGVLKAGAAFTIVDSHYADDRLDYIYKDCDCKVKIDLDTWGKAMEEEPLSGYEKTEPTDACFAVYTSGSTGNPKGVVHEYGKLKMIQLTAIKPYGEAWYAGGCRFGLIPPLNFVAALKFIVHGLYTGFRIFIVPTDTIKNPKKLKKYYLENKITDSHMAPSVIRATGDDFGPYLKRVITGSEPPNGIAFKDARLINNYTMSESAFVVAQYEIKEKGDAVPIGVPNFDLINIRLLDEQGNDVPEGETGEICFENPYFREYRNMPEETEQAKRDGIFHTGDLGRKLPDGNFVIAGRMNDMIKINGNRVEPAEIERQGKKILGLEWCAVKGFVDDDKAFLCLYYTEDVTFDVIDAKEKFGAVLPYYMVPTYYIKLDEIPLLPNGKVNKKVLPKPDTSSYRAEYVKPRNEMEEKLCRGFEEVLGIDQIGIRDDFFELGGDSLAAMELLAYLDWDQLSSTDIYNGITAERIAALYMRRITAASTMTTEEYEMEARKTSHRLTPMQVEMLDTSLFKPKFSTWNLPYLFFTEDKSKAERLRDAINKVIQSIPICSTIINFDEDCELRQWYDPSRCPVVEIEHLTEEEFSVIRKGLGEHTNVINTPLYNFRIFETEKGVYLFINRHHIATDGMGKNLLFNRIADAYNGKELPLDTYYSFLQRWEDTLENSDAEMDEKYFSERYGDVEWTQNIPADHQLSEGGSDILPYPVEVTQEMVRQYEQSTGITSNHLFNLALMLSIAKYTGKKDIMINYTFHNRTDQIGNEAMGGVYTVFPLSIRLGQYRNVAEIYDDLRNQTIGNFQHGNYNWFGLLVPDRLYQMASVTYETGDIMSSTSALAEIGLEELTVDYKDIRFFPTPLLGQVLDMPQALVFVAIYQTTQFKKESVERFSGYCKAFIKELVTLGNPAEVEIESLLARVD